MYFELAQVSHVLFLDLKSSAVSILRLIWKINMDFEQLSELFLQLYSPFNHVNYHKMTIYKQNIITIPQLSGC